MVMPARISTGTGGRRRAGRSDGADLGARHLHLAPRPRPAARRRPRHPRARDRHADRPQRRRQDDAGARAARPREARSRHSASPQGSAHRLRSAALRQRCRHPDDGRALPDARQQRRAPAPSPRFWLTSTPNPSAISSSASCRAASCSACCWRAHCCADPTSWFSTSRCRASTTRARRISTTSSPACATRPASASCSSRTICTSSWRAPTASSVSTVTSAARACRRRWRSIPPMGGCSGPRRRAPSPSIGIITITATTSPACRIRHPARRVDDPARGDK